MSGNPEDLPDVGDGACCLGSAVRGPAGCTCWAPVYDQEQAAQLAMGPVPIRRSACEDCAFRPGSPEQAGDTRYALSGEGQLEGILLGRAPFVCHQGMRRLLRLVHPGSVIEPGGPVEYDPGPGAYEPPRAGEMAWQANGQPAEICAGWAARRAALLRGTP